MTGAQQIEELAARWVLRKEEPDWSEADEQALDQWLSESDAHKVAYWRLEHGWRAADRIGALGVFPAAHETWSQSLRDHWWKPLAAAASLLLVLSAVAFNSSELPFHREPVVQTASFETPVGGRKLVDLPDGSKVELNTATAVRAELAEGRRAVWLHHGEAFFDVVPSQTRPFVVYAGPRTITVLGTKFSVRRDGSKVTVTVAEGRVQIKDAGSRQPERSSTISAGDVAIADGPSTLLASNSRDKVEEQLAWRSGMLLFDETTLAEAATEFNRYNRKQLVIEDESTANTRIGGSFQAKNVDAFVRLLEQAYGLKVESSDEKVVISS